MNGDGGRAGGPAGALTLRLASPGDLDLIVSFENEIFAEDPWSPAMLAEELAGASSRYTIVEASGVPCGYAGLKIGGDQADVMTIGVLARARGLGAGALLLDEMLAWAVEAGVREVFLDVRPSNEAALALYSSRGFAEIARRPRYFKNPVEEAVEMRLELAR